MLTVMVRILNGRFILNAESLLIMRSFRISDVALGIFLGGRERQISDASFTGDSI
jgi:hypothetical protein